MIDDPGTRLSPDEVRVHLARPETLDDPAADAAARAILSAEEHARLEGLAQPEDRRLFVTAHALARRALSRYAPVAPSAWTFATGPRGKPTIASPAQARSLRFNLSHAPGLTAVAVTTLGEVGVDVEDTRRVRDPLGLAARFFSPPEVASLHAAAEPARRRRFFELWTLKEAVIKARGDGMALPLKRFTVTVAPGGPRLAAFDPELGEDAAAWWLALCHPTEDHVLAVAVRAGSGAPVRLSVLETP